MAHLEKLLAARPAVKPATAVSRLVALTAPAEEDQAAQASYMVLAALEDLHSISELLLAWDPDHDGDDDSSPSGDTDHDYAGKGKGPKPKGKKPPFGGKGKKPFGKKGDDEDDDEDEDDDNEDEPQAKKKVKAAALAADAISALSELYVPLSVLTAAERKKPSAHTIPGSEDYPIPDEGHLSAAVARYKEGKFAGHSASEVKKHILSRAKALGKQVDI